MRYYEYKHNNYGNGYGYYYTYNPIPAIIGGVVGFIVLVTVASILACRRRRRYPVAYNVPVMEVKQPAYTSQVPMYTTVEQPVPAYTMTPPSAPTYAYANMAPGPETYVNMPPAPEIDAYYGNQNIEVSIKQNNGYTSPVYTSI